MKEEIEIYLNMTKVFYNTKAGTVQDTRYLYNKISSVCICVYMYIKD